MQKKCYQEKESLKTKVRTLYLVTKFFELLGEALAKLHNNHILHGNLCTNSILVKKQQELDSDSVCILGFGQATSSEAIDDKAVDLRLIGRLL